MVRQNAALTYAEHAMSKKMGEKWATDDVNTVLPLATLTYMWDTA